MMDKTHKRLLNYESSDLVKQPNYESSYFIVIRIVIHHINQSKTQTQTELLRSHEWM